MNESILEIRLNSGAELKIKSVRLYEEIALAQLNSKRADAMKLLKGVSTGLIPIGSLEWVAMSAVVIGAVEGVLSKGASSEGIRLLEEAIKMDQKLRKEVNFLSVSQIQQIEIPLPSLWRSPFTKEMQVEVAVPFEGIFSKNAHGPKTEIKTKTVSSAFIHNGDEFITVQTDDDSICSIRWSSVEHHNFSKPTS